MPFTTNQYKVINIQKWSSFFDPLSTVDKCVNKFTVFTHYHLRPFQSPPPPHSNREVWSQSLWPWLVTRSDLLQHDLYTSCCFSCPPPNSTEALNRDHSILNAQNSRTFKDLNLHLSSSKIIDKKPYSRLHASKFRLQSDTELLLNKQAS